MEKPYPNVEKARWIVRILDGSGNLLLDDGSEWRTHSAQLDAPGAWGHATVLVVSRPSRAGGLYTLRDEEGRVVVAQFLGFRPICNYVKR